MAELFREEVRLVKWFSMLGIVFSTDVPLALINTVNFLLNTNAAVNNLWINSHVGWSTEVMLWNKISSSRPCAVRKSLARVHFIHSHAAFNIVTPNISAVWMAESLREEFSTQVSLVVVGFIIWNINWSLLSSSPLAFWDDGA
jgi:hypothetical protein